MLRILLASERLEMTHPFVRALSADTQVQLDRVASAGKTLEAVRVSAPHLALIDHELPDSEPLTLVSQILRINAVVNSAVLSPLSEEEFHEESEGLGVLARLPLEPEKEDAAKLLGRLRKVLGR